MSLFPGKYRYENEEHDNLGVDWVIQYQFEDVDQTQAIEEFRTLIHDLEEAGFRTQVRHGYGASLIICIRLPRDRLGHMVHKSRVKDWLFAISHTLPAEEEDAIVEAEHPAEELRSVYHALTWQKELGGAGITPGCGKWKNITAAFPLHNTSANSELLRKWSRSTGLTVNDLDTIRALFGENVAFYFAFIHCYSMFLIFPAAWGVFCWFYFGPYSVTFAIVNCIWCIFFVEYWKIRELDLSFRWGVKYIGELKVDRPQYVWEKEVRDPITGKIERVFPAWKQLLRQLLLLPFASVATAALGTLIVVTFAMEVFISEVYNGPFKGYFEFLPTVLFSLSLPTISSVLNGMATRLTDYENYRTQDQYDLAQTQKTFVMNIITSFFPTLLTAFVYVPFGAKIVPYLDIFNVTGFNSSEIQTEFKVNSARLEQEVMYLSVTAQILNFGEEFVLPYVKRWLRQKWRAYRQKHSDHGHVRSRSKATELLLVDSEEESTLMNRIRNEADAEKYNVQDDILEMCVQFGYLALFGVAWPLVALGFLVNNWLEIRGDFFKLSLECQRPSPIRTDSIGPSLQGLEFLTWLGTLSTAAIVHLYRSQVEDVKLSSLLLTILIAEQTYLATRFAVRTGLEKLCSDSVRRNEARRYNVRKGYLELYWRSMANSPTSSPSRVRQQRVRFNERVDVYSSATEESHDSDENGKTESDQIEKNSDILRGSHREARFWSGHQGTTADAGVKLIQALNTKKPDRGKDFKSKAGKKID
ncbi:stress response protein Ist2 [Aspergillus sclerotialis]|uniref:Stress response protein Ist2 n=1 Tax=Aspergillus sclerotialis TaxID=2070753 RepID=A0A3A2ZYX7_9EURO|nr:stress response protein Ist2 [Aspergillus sclerotialis]